MTEVAPRLAQVSRRCWQIVDDHGEAVAVIYLHINNGNYSVITNDGDYLTNNFDIAVQLAEGH